MRKQAPRTALLIRCSQDEAKAIRTAARKTGRTLSGYVLHCLRNRLEIAAELEAKFGAIAALKRTYDQVLSWRAVISLVRA